MTDVLSQVISAATPIVVPALIAGAKRWVLPAISRPLLPLVAIGLGAGIDALNLWLTGASLGGPWGAVLGAVGIAVREVAVALRDAMRT